MTGAAEPVLAITLNPAIDLELQVNQLRRGAIARAVASSRQAGGKGINVARALQAFGVPAAAAFALGGAERTLFLELLAKDQFTLHPILISASLRTNVTVAEPGKGYIFKINESGPAVSAAECEMILDEVGKLVRGRKWVVISGSMPPGMPSDYYARITRLAHEGGAAVAIDCEGAPLIEALNEKPELVKINRRELGATVGRPMRGQSSVIGAIKELRRRGAGLLVVSDGPRSSLALDETETLRRARPPRTFHGRVFGAGDLMLAAIIANLLGGKPFAEAFTTATRLAAESVGKIIQK